ncbi:hypothetical protein RWH44_11305 [Microbacterium sp. KSW2-29]|uniref:Uncharacterized protein n=1 Tax=Microbacterium phycohabitans TaxID=3075993 RepID=A0ABU3SN74_9MICO|nr:hypothetical protein [Microbacterium sp. KSW2-29]MDU0346284.1 hypothetical protein [Microbacterium sp. KSW2-29]
MTTTTALASAAPLRHRSTFVPAASALSTARLTTIVVWASIATSGLGAAVVLSLFL